MYGSGSPLRPPSQSGSLFRSGDVIESEDLSNLWMRSSTVEDEGVLRASQQSGRGSLRTPQTQSDVVAQNQESSLHYPSREDVLNILPDLSDLSVARIFEEAKIFQRRRREAEYCRNESSRSLLELDGYVSSSSSISFQSREDSPNEHYPAPPSQKHQFCVPHSVDLLRDELIDRTQEFRYTKMEHSGRLGNSTLRSDPNSNNSAARYDFRQARLPDLDQTSCHSTSHHDNSDWDYWRKSGSETLPDSPRFQEERPPYRYSQLSFPFERHQHDGPNEDRYGSQQRSQQVPHPLPTGTATTVEIAPGHFLPLRGAQETMQAIERGTCVTVPCLVCHANLQCIDDCEAVLCPVCRVVSPNHDKGLDRRMSPSLQKPNHGVGLGLKL
jgi:hypothetical protein